MKGLYAIFGVGVLFAVCHTIQADIEYDSKLQIKLEHSLDRSLTPNFQFRGEISIKSLHSGSAGLDQIQLTRDEISSLKKLAERNDLYRLRVTTKTPDGRQNIFYTSTSACALLESSLNDILYIQVDHMGNVVATTLTTQAPCSFSGNFPDINGEFITSVYVRHMEMGPVPDTASYVQRLEREREAKERGETKDNRSFLAKYWMYIVPVVIFVLISGATNPEANAGGQ